VSERTVVHDTIVIERRFAASPMQVFAAWADPVARDRWDVPGDDWVLADSEHDFRVGGREYCLFGPPGAPRLRGEGLYMDIVPDRRIVMAGTMSDGGTVISVSLGTVEILPDSAGTLMIYTEQAAFLDDGDAPAARRKGWRQILDRLETELKS